MLKEFKEFIARGNVVDMAVGIIMGAAFTTIVQSLVSDVVMPPVGMLTGGLDFSEYYVDLSRGGYATLADAEKAGAPLIKYGKFVNAVIHFLIVAAAVFFMVKGVNRLRRAEDASQKAALPPAPPKSELLLEEIRDLLKKK